MINRIKRNDQSRWAAVAQNAANVKTPENEEFNRRIELLKIKKTPFRLLMEQVGEFHLIPDHLKKEAESLLGVEGWALVPIFKEAPAEQSLTRDHMVRKIEYELKSCPFCGSMPRYDFTPSESHVTHATVDFMIIWCSFCDYTFGSSESWQGLVDKWNRRTSNTCVNRTQEGSAS